MNAMSSCPNEDKAYYAQSCSSSPTETEIIVAEKHLGSAVKLLSSLLLPACSLKLRISPCIPKP